MEALYDSHFAQTMNTPTMISSQLTTSFEDSAPTTIKMEDLQVPFDGSEHSVRSTASPSPSSTHGSESRPVKKRKSWGQVLPEPKTNLPPRKRAKTEDEKEQRRIERVKRNRLAAHNSRERKRQEYELLQGEKDQLEHDLKAAQLTIARMNAELQTYRKKYPGEVPETVYDVPNINSDYESLGHSSARTTETVCPAQTSASFPSPVSMTMDSMDSPRDSSCQPETPNFSEAAADFDQTRYPAVSVEVLSGTGLATSSDLDFPFTLQPHTPVDEKPLDDLFDFDALSEHDSSNGASSVDTMTSMGGSDDVFFSSALFGQPDHLSCGFPDQLDAK